MPETLHQSSWFHNLILLWFYDSEEVFIGRDLAQSKGYAEHTASVIDEEVKNIIDTCYKDAKKIIEDHMEQLQKCAQMLIEKEKINQQEFESIFWQK